MRRASLALILAIAPALAAAQNRVEQRQSAAPDGVVEIDNDNGSIRVIGWAKNEIQVVGTLGRRANGLDLNVNGRRAEISVDTDNPMGTRSELEVHVPVGSRIEIDSFAAEIRVEGVNGALVAETVNGSIVLSGGFQEVEASTVNGDIEVSGNTKHARVESVNGAVSVKGASGEIEASTVNGQLTVVGAAFERASLETVSGGLRFEGELKPNAVLDAQSVSGEVELVLPASVSADFSVTSFSGEVENQLGPPAKKTSRWTSQVELEFTAGKGGASVNVETLSGGVRILKRQ